METKKIPFFSKVKKAIFNFDEYHNFAVEKISKGIIYYIILMLIFSLSISVASTYKMYNIVNKSVKEKLEVISDFRFEDNELILEEKEKIIFTDVNEFFDIVIIDAEKTSIDDTKYKHAMVILKDKMILNYKLTDDYGISQTIPYKELAEKIDLNNITKQSIINYLDSSKIVGIYLTFFIVSLICTFICYSLIILFDILLLSVLGILISRIFKLNLKYIPVLNMSFYAMTLSILLYAVCIIIDMLAGFEVKYFRVAYDGIAYIYIITAILMIKSDLIKQQMELMRIVEVQKQVKQELEEQKEEEQRKEQEKEQEKKEDTKSNKEKKKGKEDAPEGEPEGSKA